MPAVCRAIAECLKASRIRQFLVISFDLVLHSAGGKLIEENINQVPAEDVAQVTTSNALAFFALT